MRRVFCALFLTVSLFAGGKDDSAAQTRDDVVVVKLLVAESASAAYNRSLADNFNELQDRIRVEIIGGPTSATELYALILQVFESQQNSVDILPVDTIWPGDFAEHLVDLNTLGGAEIAAQMFDGLIDNNTLDGRLLALPSFNTAGLMLYRDDLLQKYGYNRPPSTWDELEEMASVIQQGERSENTDFWGYVWQGQSYEGLVCNFLEWTYSNGDDVWIDKNRQITINNPQTIDALQRAKGWIGTITPPGVLAFKEEESRAVFQAGNAAFMRNWFYAYGLANSDQSTIKGLVKIAPVPAGDAGHGASTIGAWSTGISRYSKHPQEAFEFLKFSISYENTLNKAKLTSEFPPYTAAYEDQAVLEDIPALELLGPIFENSVARPSTITAPNYNAASTMIARSVHNILSGRSDTTETLGELALDLEELTGFEIAN